MLFSLNIKNLGLLMMFCFLSLLFQCLDEVIFWPEQYPEWSQRSWLESRNDVVYLIVCLILWVIIQTYLISPSATETSFQLSGEGQDGKFSLLLPCRMPFPLVLLCLYKFKPPREQLECSLGTWLTMIRSLFSEICNVIEI